MASGSRRSKAIARGIALGLTASALAAGVHRAGWDRWAEYQALDWRFRGLPTLQPSERIVHVDLDDKALEQIGRWPWPRRRLAQLVETLNDCGAELVALDIILPHPQEPRFVREGTTDLYQAASGGLLNPAAPPVPVLDDVELAEAFARADNLFVSMHVDLLGESPGRREASPGLARRLEDMVATRPAVTRAEAQSELPDAGGQVEELMVPAKEEAFERRVADLLTVRADLSLKQAAADLLGGAAGGEDYDILRRAYLRRRALAEMSRFALPPRSADAGPMPTGRLVPPLVTLGQRMAHTGFVTVKPDEDGVIRRIPLLARTDGGVFEHLALALAAEVLGRRHGGVKQVAMERRRVVVHCGDGSAWAIPVDEKGYLQVNWARSGEGWRAGKHISAVAAGDVWGAREQLRRNQSVARLACLSLARIINDSAAIELFAQADEVWQAVHEDRVRRQAALLFDPGNVPGEPTDLLARETDLEHRIDAACRSLIETADFLLAGPEPQDPQEAQRYRQVKFLRGLVASAEQDNVAIRRRIEEATERLRREVEGKICLVGSAATGAADFVPTPIHQRTPGVVVHANALNTILSGRFVRTQGAWVSALVVLLAGALVALFTASRGAIQSAMLLLAAIAGYALLDGTVWAAWTYWLVAAMPVAAMFFVWALITLYRQLTEEHQRRQITTTFKQYLSPAMVDELVQDPTQASLGGQRRRLSCLFSDLAGFTAISERLGPEKTVNLLNRFLDQAGEVLQQRHGGTLSKYEGDGIFAFFGAPIPQPDHPARAIRAALDCQGFLPEFNRALHADGLLPEGMDLSMRIGITTGEVFVGNMGSTQRVAYTAIGDEVNLASRLETANKFFGTRILVNEAAWRSGADGAPGRPMGRIIVVGKSEPVGAYEPLGAAGTADEPLLRLIEEFTRAVEAYSRGDAAAAAEAFRRVLEVRDDPPARVFLRLCEQALADPAVRAGFDGVTRLTEK